MTNSAHLNLKLRIYNEDEIAFGPGKAELLLAIYATGSISKAAKQMNMSYRRAWQLVETMNHSFQSGLVETQKGGTHGGGAKLTDLGESILSQFRQMEIKARVAIEQDFEEIAQHLKQ